MRRVRLGQRDLDLLIACKASIVHREDDDRDHIAQAVAQVRQQVQPGAGAKRNIEHREVDALGRERVRALSIESTEITSAIVCECIAHDCKHVVVVIEMKNAGSLVSCGPVDALRI